MLGWTLVASVIVLPLATFAQTEPKFEVASVKASAMQDRPYGIGFSTYPGGRVRANMCKLDYLISLAYDIQLFQITGGPRWIREDRFDLEAKPPASSQSSKSNPNNPKLPPNEEQRLMLQALLADRFQLLVHKDVKEAPVYLLVKTTKPLGLVATKDKNEYPWVGSLAGAGLSRDGIRGTNATMKLLAERLSENLDRPVIDRTGIEGAFDFRFALPAEEAGTDEAAALFASVQGLGLKLEAGRGPVETLVVDRAERPAGN